MLLGPCSVCAYAEMWAYNAVKMPDPFTIRIFVPNGDPEGVRLVDRMNWTGAGNCLPAH